MDWRDVAYYYVGTMAVIFLFLKMWGIISEGIQSALIIGVAIIGVLAILVVVISNTKGKTQWSRVAVILILALFNVVFWSGFEQAGGTFNLFAEENTNRFLSLFNWEFPASGFQSVNPLLIVSLAPLFSLLWVFLSKMKQNPRTPVKFGLGLMLLSAGFFVMSAANGLTAGDNLVSPFWLIGVYILHTSGELLLSPIGLSMITKLAPPPIVSVMMGLWMASWALGNYLAATMESLLQRFNMELYSFIAIEGLIAGGLLLLISPLLNKMMKGIH